MVKVLVLGASGLLGSEVYRICKKSESIQVVGTCHSRKNGDYIPVDIRNTAELDSLLDDVKPDTIVNCIAVRFPEVVEKDPITTKAINVDFPEYLAKQCKQRGIFLIHISTDYVFDGENAPYHPHDPTNPLNKYAKSKLESEAAVSENCDDYLVIRVPVLYGPGNFQESAVLYMYKQVVDGEDCYVDHIQQRVPTLTTDIAKTIRNLIESKCSLRGIVHLSAEKEFTKYEMAILMGKMLGVSTDHIHPQLTVTSNVKRPYNCHLDCSELRATGCFVMRDFEEGLREVFGNAGLLPKEN